MRQPGATPRGSDRHPPDPSPEKAAPPQRPRPAVSGLAGTGDRSWSRGVAPGCRISPLRGFPDRLSKSPGDRWATEPSVFRSRSYRERLAVPGAIGGGVVRRLVAIVRIV